MYAAFSICTHLLQYALIFCCYRRPNFTPSANLTPLKCVCREREKERSFDFPWYNFFCYYYDYYFFMLFQVAPTEYLKLIEVLEHRFCRCVCYFSIWSLSMSSRSFWTLSKYESIKCQVLFRLLFNVNGMNIFWKCCANNFNEICEQL